MALARPVRAVETMTASLMVDTPTFVVKLMFLVLG